MNRWRMVVGIVLMGAGIFDLFSRAYISSGAYLSFGAFMLLQTEQPGARRMLALFFCVGAIALLVIKMVGKY